MDILLINGSPRRGGNTEIMADAFIDGARQSGNTVTKINLSETKVKPCVGCDYCQAHDGVCVQKDGMSDVFAAMDKADMVVLASPIYSYGLTAQIAAVLNRLYARDSIGYHPSGCALLLDSYSPDVFSAAVEQYRELAAYLKWKDRGFVAISGMVEKGAMKTSPELPRVVDFARSFR
ncbi:MAG: flavodoxin family protein [Clostridia bacterium]|nr:flavodoxin family protein [Clostridia bacterium]MDR3644579.1 flavodoxin family protein [Clostridia bacterium]